MSDTLIIYDPCFLPNGYVLHGSDVEFFYDDTLKNDPDTDPWNTSGCWLLIPGDEQEPGK